MPRPQAPIGRIAVGAYRVPTDAPESDGTLEWDSTTLVLVTVEGGGAAGLGYTYAPVAAGKFVEEKLAESVQGFDALDIPAAHAAMVRVTRNAGRPGIASAAISALDNALWDLKGKLLGTSVAGLLGRARERVPLYGSGGFTAYDQSRLRDQLGGWATEGFRFVKMKVSRDPAADPARVQAAKEAIGTDCELFVDANGAYTVKQALLLAESFAQQGVRWFEEPVSSDDLAGMRVVRERAPAGMDVSAGEYGYDPFYFRRMLEAAAVDVLQADATRCGGITGFMQAAALAHAFHRPLSSHCAPSLHIHACAAAPGAIHAEWFHDHVRIERMLFDGVPAVTDGKASATSSDAGFGLILKERDAAAFAV